MFFRDESRSDKALEEAHEYRLIAGCLNAARHNQYARRAQPDAIECIGLFRSG
jgi:hypothetical protein